MSLFSEALLRTLVDLLTMSCHCLVQASSYTNILKQNKIPLNSRDPGFNVRKLQSKMPHIVLPKPQPPTSKPSDLLGTLFAYSLLVITLYLIGRTHKTVGNWNCRSSSNAFSAGSSHATGSASTGGLCRRSLALGSVRSRVSLLPHSLYGFQV